MAQYFAEVLWVRGGQPFVDNRYSRRHLLRFDGGLEVPGSSSPHVVPQPMSDASAVDPEEAFVSALSSCHMLWFLSIAARRGFCADRYFDAAVGEMHRNAAGQLAMCVKAWNWRSSSPPRSLPETQHRRTTPSSRCWRTILGLGTAVLLGYTLFAATVRLDLRRFFQVTGILLILFAAGLVAHGVHEFNEVGWIPSVVVHVWDVNMILDENSVTGQLLKTLFGYNGNPSLTEMISYFVYIAVVVIFWRRDNAVPAKATTESRA